MAIDKLPRLRGQNPPSISQASFPILRAPESACDWSDKLEPPSTPACHRWIIVFTSVLRGNGYIRLARILMNVERIIGHQAMESSTMPIHNWSRVEGGLFHDFHQAWTIEIRNALNAGVLPPQYFALAEQV